MNQEAVKFKLDHSSYARTETFLKEFKEFTRLLMVLSVAMITILGASHNPQDDVHWLYDWAYKIMVICQLVSIYFGVRLHITLVSIFASLSILKDETDEIPSDITKGASSPKAIMKRLYLQLGFFAASFSLLGLLILAE